jgi:hypothetical protein
VVTARSPYGRSPAQDALDALRESDRLLYFWFETGGRYVVPPPGVTLYRKSPGVWLELPDPEKVK